MTIKNIRKDFAVRQGTDAIIEMPRLVDVNLNPIDLTSAVFYANFTNSITSQTSYIIEVTKNTPATDGIYYLNILPIQTASLELGTYIYTVDVVINSIRSPIAFGNIIITKNVS